MVSLMYFIAVLQVAWRQDIFKSQTVCRLY